jgi:hypothetical protein
MRRRDISKALIAATAGSAAALTETAQAQSAGAARYAQTAAELAAGVMPLVDALLPGQPDRYLENTHPGGTDMQQGFARACEQARQPGGAPVLIASQLAIATDIALPIGVPVLFSGTGGINLAAGVTLTIQGYVGGPRNTVFTGAGKVVFTQSAQPEVYPEWWGARGDSRPNTEGGFTTVGTDSTLALAECILAAAGGAKLNIGVIPIRIGNGYYMTGNQTLPPATVIRGLGRETCGFIAKSGTTGASSGASSGAWFTDTGNAAKIILEDFAMFACHAECPKMVYALRLGYNGTPHGTEGYLQGLWIRDCACYRYGFHCDILGNVGYYDRIATYCNNLYQQSGLRIQGTANMCTKLTSVSAGSPAPLPWIAGTEYAVNSYASVRGAHYRCIRAHNANAAHAPANSNHWEHYPYSGHTYGIFLNGAGIQVHGMEIEAISSHAIALSIQNNTDINGVVFSLADFALRPGKTEIGVLDHVWELGLSATTWKLSGVTYVFAPGASARITGGNAQRADGTYFAGNATGHGAVSPWTRGTAYLMGNLVSDDGVDYICIRENHGERPPSLSYWNVYHLAPHSGEGNWRSDTAGQRLQSFTLRIANVHGELHHRIAEPGGAPTHFASTIYGATAAFTKTPAGLDESTAFAGGGKIGSAAPGTFWLDTPDQAIADSIGAAFVSFNSTGTALNVVASVRAARLNGETKNRLCFQLTNAATGADFALQPENFGGATGSAIVQICWLGSISD